jgi:digeranylgeranylglycerophospholipid reductase
MLEKEVAALAVRAGARLYLKTRVTGLIRSGQRVAAVETNSGAMPRAEAKIVICADGIRSAAHGFAATEGLCESLKPLGGVSYVLAGADISPGVIEHFLSADPLLNYRTFFTHGDGLSYLGMPTASAFQDIKAREDNEVSRKFKHAFPVELSGYARTSGRKYADYFEAMVKDNVLFVGDASGGAGNIHGMIQGQFAGTIAASALKDKEITEERLSEYQGLVRNTLGKAPFFYFTAREDFGSFGNWFREVEAATQGITAAELSQTP